MFEDVSQMFHQQATTTWVTLLPWTEYWYNTSLHHSLGMTPFKAGYGRDPTKLTKYYPNEDNHIVQVLLTTWDPLLAKLKTNLHLAKQCMKTQADKKPQELQFQVGQKIWVKLQPHRQHSICLRKNQKLGMKYFGPFPIVKKIGKVAYNLSLLNMPKHTQFSTNLN